MKEQNIYCNPLPLPDIGIGFTCQLNPKREKKAWEPDFREIADPEMLFHDGVWYMYPSVSQVYFTRDLIHWEYRPIEIEYPLGYAPSAVFFRGKFLLTCSANPYRTPRIFQAPSPFGPFKCIGEPKLKDGSPVTEYLDPSLFVDEDERLYLYWGCAPSGGGIYGMEMNPEDPTTGKADPVKLIDFNTANEWEHYGEYNEHLNHGWDEGASMLKHNGVYYLQYSACGTNFRNYSIACYQSRVSPLGPFDPPENVMLRQPHGIVTGTGHGGMVHGKDNSVWQFYTCLIRRLSCVERRIGMDQVTFDPDGRPSCTVTSTPQSLTNGSCGWVPVSVDKPAASSSCAQNSFAWFANDECTHTWWEPDENDPEPFLTINLAEYFAVQAIRIIWTDTELSYAEGRLQEPVRWKVEFLDKEKRLLPGTLDLSANRTDLNIDFRILEKSVRAFYVRLVILRKKNQYRHGVTDFTVFAKPGGEKV